MTSSIGLSVVIPVFNGALSVGTLVDALAGLPVAEGLEIVLVNDGSRDNSLSVCLSLAERHPGCLVVIDLARNFGEHNAVMAGLAQARGTYVVTMDDDLQNPVDEVLRLYDHARANDHDIVYSYSIRREQAFWRNLGSRFANWCADQLIDKPRGLYLSSFRCMSAFAVRNILAYRGPYPYVDGLLMQVTQRIGRIEVAHMPRAGGHSNYTFWRLVRLWMSIMLNFSVVPLRIAGVFAGGFFVLGLGGLLATYVGGSSGTFSLEVVILFAFAAQFLVLGIIGEFLGRLFLSANGKPQFVVRSVTRVEVPQEVGTL